MLKQKQKISTKAITQVSVMTALIAVLTQISMPLPGGVPFTLQTMGVMLAGIILGPKKGTLSVLIYVVMGAIGLPVFANFSGGFAVLLGPTGGYIVGFIFGSAIIGLLSSPIQNRVLYYIKLLIGILLGQIIIFGMGIPWLMFVLNTDLSAGLAWGLTPFIIPEIIKTALAVILGTKISAALKTRKPPPPTHFAHPT